MNNFVAKHAHKFNRAVTMVDRKKHAKQTGYDETWFGLGEFEREMQRDHGRVRQRALHSADYE